MKKKRTKRVTVVFTDPFNALKLVEARAETREVPTAKGLTYRVDRTAAEAYARARLATETEETPMSKMLKEIGVNDHDFTFVGILVAHEDQMAPGRITWAELVETQEAVGV